ncbi:MAG TPA: ABC transporter permease, partial [Longimicrobiales bacterium]|nr:ABC transporter permease [Longimicrobiales bacterium]
LTLALGIGASVAIFSVVNGVLLRPLPYPDPEGLVVPVPVDTRDGSPGTTVDHPDVRTWQAEIDGLTLAGYSGARPTLTGIGEPEVIDGVRVTDGLLEVFGLQPAMGRDIRRDEDVPDGPNVVVVSHAFWRERLGSDPEVLGRSLVLSGESWEVVGVAPAGFDFPDGSMLWMPRHHSVAECGHGCGVLRPIGRLAPGTSLGEVQDRMDAVSARLAEEHPDAHRDSGIRLERLLDVQVADVRVALWILMGAVMMVLLIACANVANLLLVRAGDRTGEVALRRTLGAHRVRVVRQLLTESLLLSSIGGVLGIGLASWGVSAIVSLAPPGIPHLDRVSVDGRVLLFALSVVLGVTLLFGLAPAVKLAGRPLQGVLGQGRGAAGRRGAERSRALLLSAEVALSLMLLLGAGLLVGTLHKIRAVDPGFAVERVERFRMSTPESRYDTESAIRLFDELEGRLAALPEVALAGSAFGIPLGSGSISTSVTFPDREPVDVADQPSMAIRAASPGYLEASGIPLLRGRWFDASDVRATGGVAVVNQAAVRRHYPDKDPIGKPLKASVSWGFEGDFEGTIVGVVGDTRSRSLTRADEPAMYVPNAQFGANSVYVTLRLRPGAASAMPGVRAVLAEMDPALAITSWERMEDVVAEELAPTRFYLTLLGAFSILALVLAAVGLYGVVAYAVSRRTREIGIRVALGARGDDVVGMMVREGVRPALAGVAVGLAVSWFGARALGSLLYGVEPQDPLILASVTGILLAVVAAATLVPARRATRIAPTEALRSG